MAQDKIVHLLKFDSHKPLYLLTRDNSYEIAKLVGYWIIEKFIDSKAYLIKGKISPTLFHVVLLIEEDGEFWILDPSIWKFFRFKRNIIVGKVDSTEEALKLMAETYKGKWHTTEKLSRNHIKSHETALIQLIKKMAHEKDNL